MNFYLLSGWRLLLFIIVSGVLGTSFGAAAAQKQALPVVTAQAVVERNSDLKDAEQEKILTQIRKKYSSLQAFSGRFTQTTTYADSNDTTMSMGRIWIQGPDKMRWEYQQPEKQLLLSDGKTIWYYTPDLNQVMVGKIEDIKEARVIVNLLAKLKSRQKGLRLNLFRADNQIIVVLKPLIDDKAPPFQSLKMIFEKSSFLLKKTQMEDLFANKITITYKWESGPDPVLPAAHFKFVPPVGCDVMPLGQ